MQTMEFTVHSDQIIRPWPRIEQYQNSTLRYTPPADFPAHWQRQNGRVKMIRVWVTLDEIWNIEDDTYNWNYRIGVDRLGEKRYYPYDWPNTRPSDTLFEDYLTSYCAMADEAMLNIRRFERETADGVLSYEKYEEVCEKVIEHCRDLCGNIAWIEVSNESEIGGFGGLTVEEYMSLYNAVCRAVNRLNARRGWSLKVGGTAMTGSYATRGLWHEYMKALAEDTCPDRRIDFYSFHSYNHDVDCLQQLYSIHKSDVAKYNLPDAPVFFDEYGTCAATGVLTDSLQNACETLTGMLRGADLPGMYVFPWCTFHNPNRQISYTQYVRLPDDTYAPTPNGQAVHMLFGMLENELRLECQRYIYDQETGKLLRREAAPFCSQPLFRARATGDTKHLYLIVTNPADEPLTVNCHLSALEGSRAEVVIRQVDAAQNNAVTGPVCRELGVTETREIAIEEGESDLQCLLPPFGFACWSIQVLS